MRIGIIGAGICGLTAAKTLRTYGAQVTVYEPSAQPGGTWAHAEPDQIPSGIQPFTDYPFPDHFPAHPSPEQRQAYLQEYLSYHQLFSCLRFHTTLTEAEPQYGAGWRLSLRESSGRQYQEEVDFLLLCADMQYQLHIPPLPQRTEFELYGGQVRHTHMAIPVDQFRGQRVVVTGNSLESLQILVRLAESSNRPPTQLYSAYEGAEPVLAKARFRKLRNKALQVAALTPTNGHDPLTLLARYQHLVSERAIRRIEGDPIAFMQSGLELHSGKTVEADAVIFGTGLRLRLPFLAPKWQQHCTDVHGQPSLYRGILPLKPARMAFVGYHDAPHRPWGAELVAHWLGEHLFGYRSMPGKSFQQLAIETASAHPTARRPRQDSLEEVLKDLGFATKSSRWFGKRRPLGPIHYPNLWQQLRQRTPSPLIPAAPSEPQTAATA